MRCFLIAGGGEELFAAGAGAGAATAAAGAALEGSSLTSCCLGSS